MSGVRTDFDVRVPIADGVELSADVWRPAADAPVHLVLARTPYGKNTATAAGLGKLFPGHGFAFAMVDVRDRGDSDGTFWPYVADGRDGADCPAWFAEQDWVVGQGRDARRVVRRAHPVADRAPPAARRSRR